VGAGVGTFEDDDRREALLRREPGEPAEARLQFRHLLAIAFLVEGRVRRGALEQPAGAAARLLRDDGGPAARGLVELVGDREAGMEVAEFRLGGTADELPG